MSLDLNAIIAIIIASTLGPMLVAWLTARQRRREKHEDWQRQDEVASRVEQVASTLHEDVQLTNGKLDELHVLANSVLTQALSGQLTALKAQVLLLKEGRQTEAKKAALKEVEAQVKELTRTMEERARQAEVIANIASSGKKKKKPGGPGS